MTTRRSVARLAAHALAASGLVWLIWGVVPGIARGAEPGHDDRAGAIARGRDLFLKGWGPGAPSEQGGGGLGPVYTATSCAACHNLGGLGGAGPVNKNVDLITALARRTKGDVDTNAL